MTATTGDGAADPRSPQNSPTGARALVRRTAPKSSKIAGAKSVTDLKGAQVDTTSYRSVIEMVEPSQQPQVFNNNDDAKKALQNG